MTLRAALVGCGRIGSEFDDDPKAAGVGSHAGAYTQTPGVELVAVCDDDEGKARRCGERWGVRAVFTDLGAMLSDIQPDLVSVCTPDPTHADLLRLVLGAPGVRGVLSEKPLADDVGAARDVVRLAHAREIVLAVNHSRRYAPGHQTARQLIASGAIGRVQHVSGSYTKGVRHNGTHWFDLLRWIAGEASSVRGFETAGAGAGAADPTIDVRLELRSGATGFLQGCDAGAFTIFELDVVGTNGRVRFLESGRRVQLESVVDDPRYPGYRVLGAPREWPGGLDEAMTGAVADLAACVAVDGARQPACTGEDGLAALELAEAAHVSARTRAAIDIAAPQAAR